MFITIMSFVLTAIPFALFYLFARTTSWVYYVPCSLIIAHIWLGLMYSRFKRRGGALAHIYPDIFSNEVERNMFLASPSIFLPRLELTAEVTRLDFTSAQSWTFYISLVYGVISLVRAEWIALTLCVMVAVYYAFGNMKSAFETGDPQMDALKVVTRYEASQKKTLTDLEHQELMLKYLEICEKLSSFTPPDPPQTSLYPQGKGKPQL